MSWIYEVFEVLATACESVLILWLLSSFFGFKSTVKQRYILFVSFAALITAAVTICPQLLPNKDFICTLIYIVIIFVFGCFLNGRWVNHLLIILAAETLLVLIAVSIISVMSYIASYSSTELINGRGAERVAVLIFSKLLLFLAYKVILISHKNKPDLQQTEWIAFAAIFFSTLLTGICVYEIQINGYADGGAPLFPLSVLCLVVINLVSFYMLSKISKEHRENINNSLLVMQLREQESNISEMKNVYNEIKRIRHNIKEQYGCVQELLMSGKYEQAKNYLSEVKIPNLLLDPLTVTDDDTLNAILNYLSHKCSNSNIKLNCFISSNDIACFSAADISVILTNLVNNSLEACVESFASEIKLELYEQKNYFCISVKNPIAESVLIKNPFLATTKQNKDMHGFGVESVKLLAEKYNGITKFREDGLVFVAEVWLKRPIRQE